MATDSWTDLDWEVMGPYFTDDWHGRVRTL
jgi:hypothetical protein